MTASLLSIVASIPGSSAAMLMLLAKATLLLIVALGITVTMQRASAGARHLVWLVTLGTLLIVPAIAKWSPLELEILPARAAPVDASPAAPAVTTPAPVTSNAPAANAVSTPEYITGNAATAKTSFFSSLSPVSIAIGIWAAVVVLLAGWLAYGALVVRRIVRNSQPLDTQDWMTPLWEIADRLELDEPPRLLGSSEAKMPFACGFITPTIVLPADCEKWTPDRRRAVLLHELAHVKRRDLVGHTLGRLACAVYWFHPLVWTAAKQLRNESERACDDLALACGARASDYAEHLLDIVTSVRHDATPAVALAMARRKDFEGRMLAILDPELRHSSPNRRQSIALAGTLALIALVVGAAAPVQRAPTVVGAAAPTATETPAIDKSFVPQDVAEPQDPKPLAIKEGNEKESEIEKEGAAPREAVDANDASGVEAEPRVSVYTKTDVAVETKTDLIERAMAAIGVERSGALKVKAPDERATLLANILRTDKDATLRRTAAWGLSEYADTEVAAEALSFAVRKDSDPGVREMSAWALNDARQNSVAVSALSEALKGDANTRVRAISAWSLGNIGDEDAVTALVNALSDADKNVRLRALWAIGNIEPRRAPPQVLALLRDSQPMVRQLAAWTLFQIEDPAGVPALNAALQAETIAELRIDYIRALAALGEKSVDAIRGLLLSSDPKIKSIAVRALAGGNGAGPWPWPWPEPRPYP